MQEEQSWQKDEDDTEKTLLKIEQRLQEVQSVLIQAKVTHLDIYSIYRLDEWARNA